MVRAAELGVLAFDRWSDAADQQPLADLARQAFDEARAAIAALG